LEDATGILIIMECVSETSAVVLKETFECPAKKNAMNKVLKKPIHRIQQ